MKIGQEQLSFLNMLFIVLSLGIEMAARVKPSFSCLLTVGLFLVFCSAFFLAKSSKWTYIVFLLLFFIVGAFRFAAEIMPISSDVSKYIGDDVTVKGKMIEAPYYKEDIRNGKMRYLLEIEEVIKGQEKKSATGRIYVHFRCGEKEKYWARIGDNVTARGRVVAISGYENPGRIDTVFAKRSQGIQTRLLSKGNTILIEKDNGFFFYREIEKIRGYYRERMESVMPKEDAAALFGMLFGGYDGIKEELVEAFSITGIVHILSVSGSHITLLAVVIANIGKRIRLKRKISFLLFFFFVSGYVLLAGAVSPAVRAGIMGILVFLGELDGRKSDARRLLVLAALAMLIFNPLLFYDISFRLSILSTAGLIYLSPLIRERLTGLPNYFALGLSVTIGAQLAVIPIISWYFNMVSLSSFIANLLIVPLVEVLIMLGLAGGIVFACLPFAGKLIFLFESMLLGVVYELARMMARIPFSSIYLPTFNIFFSFCYYSCLILIVNVVYKKKEDMKFFSREKICVIAVSFIICVVGLFLIKQSTKNEMSVHFIDVGQGDAALVITPNGKALMFDTGGVINGEYDIGARVVAPYLLHYGVRSLDAVYLTHAHEDHAQAVSGLINKIPIEKIVIGPEGREQYTRCMGVSSFGNIAEKMMQAVEGRRTEIDGVIVEEIYVPRKMNEENENSCVYRVRYKNASFLFTGDLTKEKEDALLAKASPKTTVLKVAHHGSKTSSSSRFLAETGAKWAVISVGRGNRFGHPSEEVIKRLRVFGIKILRTDESGAIVFYTNGEKIRFEKYVESKLKL